MDVRITFNFEENLSSIDRFLRGQSAAHAFESLLDDLFEVVIPNLRRHPRIGVDLLSRSPLSREGGGAA